VDAVVIDVAIDVVAVVAGGAFTTHHRAMTSAAAVLVAGREAVVVAMTFRICGAMPNVVVLIQNVSVRHGLVLFRSESAGGGHETDN